MNKITTLLLSCIFGISLYGQTTYYVETTTDDPADTMSFRYQVMQANLNPGHDIIQFNPATYGDTIFFDSTVVLTEGVTILGSSTANTILAGNDVLGPQGGIIQMMNTVHSRFEFHSIQFLAMTNDSCSGVAQDAAVYTDTLFFDACDFRGFNYALFLDDTLNNVDLQFCRFISNNYAFNSQVNKSFIGISYCEFDGQRGIDAYIQANEFNIFNNLFHNSAASAMGSVYIMDPANPSVDCKFVNNTLINGQATGLTINDNYGNMAFLAIHNNIIWGNSPFGFKQEGATGNAQYAKNIVDTVDNTSTVFPTFYSSSDPFLNGNLLTASSIMAIDSADATYAPSDDYDGNPVSGGARDIGAFEFNNICAGFSVNASGTNPSCNFGSNGTATVTPTGGTAPYTYNWTNSGAFNETTQSVSNLSADSYYIHVQDNNGCNVYDTVIIVNPPSLQLDTTGIVITPASCGNANGSITGITSTGGTGSHSYDWWNGPSYVAGTQDLVNVEAGTMYQIRVVDSAVCAVFSGWIEIPSIDSNITVNVNTTNAFCNQSFTGSAVANVTGGVAPYVFNWSTGTGNDSITNIAAGNYWLVVEDANGCQSTQQNFTINEFLPIQITATPTAATCGINDGMITVSAAGGVAPYSYNWSQAGLTGTTISNLYSGNYQVTVTDANGCVNNANIWVPASGITLNANITQPSCHGGNDGSIDLTVTPGGAYTYLWSNGQNTEDAFNLSSGFYTLTVSNGTCVQTDSFSVGQPVDLDIFFSTTPASGCATNDGMIVLSGIGGTGATTLELFDDNGSLGTGSTFTSLAPGPYIAYITDANGCTDSVSIGLAGTAPGTPIAVTISNITPSACLSTTPTDPGNGGAMAAISGGTAPYTIRWTKYLSQSGQGLGSGTVMSTALNPTNLSAGQYIVKVEDANDCEYFTTVGIPGSNLAPQEICMVTVQQDWNNNQQNVIVWEKNAGLGIDYYEIWRLEANGSWQYRDSVEFNSLSQYIDYGTDPNASYYSYQLRTVDQCGFQSVYTANHATIQLSLDTANITPASAPNNYDGSISMQWNQYGGSLSLTSYDVRRTVVESGVTISDSIIGSVPYGANQQSYTFTDNQMPGDNGQRSVFYQIESVFPSSCVATKAQDYNGTRSNRSAGMFGGGYPAGLEEIAELNGLFVYPNPSKDMIHIETVQGVGDVLILDMYGKVVDQFKINGKNTTYNIGKFKNGTYFLNYTNSKYSETKRIIVLN